MAKKAESGLAYVALLFVLLMLFTLGLMYLAETGTSLGTAAAAHEFTQADYLAEAAVREAIWRLENDCGFTPDAAAYILGDMNNGRYGYRVRYDDAADLALISSFGLVQDHYVEQRHVVPLPPWVRGLVVLAYGESNLQPKSREFVYEYCGGTVGDPLPIVSLGSSEVRYVQMAAHPDEDLAIMAMLDGNGQTTMGAYVDGAWEDLRVFDDKGRKEYRSFDIDFEQSSGDGLMVGWVVKSAGNASISFNVYRNNNWVYSTSPEAFTISEAGIRFLDLAMHPSSDEGIVAVVGGAQGIYLRRWTGNGWTNYLGLGNSAMDTASTIEGQPVGVAYESQSGEGLVVWGRNGTTQAYYCTVDGSNLGAASSFASLGAPVENVILKPEPGTNRIACMISDESDGLRLMFWDGSAWVYDEAVESATQQFGSLPALNFDVTWEAESGDGLAVWTRQNSNSVRFVSWPAGGTPSAGSAAFGANMLDRIYGLRLMPLPGTDRILATVNTASMELRSANWDGDQFDDDPPETLVASMGSNEGLPFDTILIPGAVR